MHVSANAEQSSSLLPMLDAHRMAAPNAYYVGHEDVTMARLDSVVNPTGPLLLKLDVQGYETEVLSGAERLLSYVQIVVSELSLRALYEGQATIEAMLRRFSSLGLVLVALRPAFCHQGTGEILQVDGVFVRASDPSPQIAGDADREDTGPP